MIEKLKYFLKEGLRGIWVNRMMSFASVLVLCISLIMLGTALLASMNINSFLTQLESRNQIMVYLNKGIDQTSIDSVGQSINSISNVRSSAFISKDQIFDDAKKTLGSQNVMMDGIDSSTFNCAYKVEINDLTKYSETVQSLQKIKGVEYVRKDEGLASILTKIQRYVNLIGIWLFVALAVISLFVISNTIKLAMFSRKREINIMKFVGATDWFIRWPFVIEGILIGAISGLVAILAQYLIYEKLIVGIIRMLNVAKPLDYGGMAVYITPAFIIGGMLVGSLGSVLSVRKYLKV